MTNNDEQQGEGGQTMNESTIKGKWTEIKGEIQKAWGRLTNDELEQTKGDTKSIVGLLHQKYGEQKEDYEGRLNSILSRYHQKRDDTAESIKDDLKH